MPRAIPTLFKVPNPPQPLLGKRQPPKSRSVVTTKKARSTAVGNDVEQPGDNADYVSNCTTFASSPDVQLTPRKIELTNKLKLAKKQLAPSPGLFELCNAMERIVQMNIEAVIAGPAVMGSLKDLISQGINTDSFNIEICCQQHRIHCVTNVITLFLRIRIHHFVKIRNRELQELAEKKKDKVKRNRKVKKVVHQ